jgi:hypothetical protein
MARKKFEHLEILADFTHYTGKTQANLTRSEDHWTTYDSINGTNITAPTLQKLNLLAKKIIEEHVEKLQALGYGKKKK